MFLSMLYVFCEAIHFLQQASNGLENLGEINYKPFFFISIHLHDRLYYKKQ